MRNYCYSQIPNETKDEFIIQIDKEKNLVKYQPINAKLALTKKRKVANFDDEKGPVESTQFI